MRPEHELPHAAVDEWVFAAWTAGAGVISGYRITGRLAWYWTAVVTAGQPLVRLLDSEVVVRTDPMVVKGHGLWADHVCDEPLRQWTVSNEAVAVALDDPASALGRAYGDPTPLAMDLEWYATADPAPLAADDPADGYQQTGVVHGVVEVAGRQTLQFAEVPAHRWRRWVSGSPADHTLAPLRLSAVRAHAGLRAPFAFADGGSLDLVLTSDGWHVRGADEPDR